MSIIMYKQRFKKVTDPSTPIKNYLHIGYIAMRPRSVKNQYGEHALFGYLSPTQPCDSIPWQESASYVRKLSKQKVNMFRSILSFRREDAKERGLLTQKDWQEYAEQHIRMIAEKNNIDRANLGWCAAYHNEGEHPHLHFVFWDNKQQMPIPYVPPEIGNKIRIALIKATFEDKIQALYLQKKMAKEDIANSYEKAVEEFVQNRAYLKETYKDRIHHETSSVFQTYGEGQNSNITQLFHSEQQLDEITQRLLAICENIPLKGRITYQFLPEEVKMQIDKLTNDLIDQNKYLHAAVELYMDSQCNLKSFYSNFKSEDDYNDYRKTYGMDAKKQIRYQIVRTIKSFLLDKDYCEIAPTDWMEQKDIKAQMKHRVTSMMYTILDYFACSVAANHSEWQEKKGRGVDELSELAKKEWVLLHKDKGMEC